MANQNEHSTPSRKLRGFAALNPERQKEIARQGGIAAHVKGTAHQFTSEEAKAAGRKGGLAKGSKNEGPIPYVLVEEVDAT